MASGSRLHAAGRHTRSGIKGKRQRTKNKRTVTILIPCYNEEESLPMLFARLTTLSENA